MLASLLTFAAMINYTKFSLPNGLKVLVHEDDSTPIAVVDVIYDVGARDENPDKTGFAHLFEHLMFGGSIHIPSYDAPLQMAGGKTMHSPPTILRTIIASSLQIILKQLSGLRATEC